MGQDVAVERPGTDVLAIDDHVPALAGVNAKRVAREFRCSEGPPVPDHDAEWLSVQMPWMRHDALIHEPDKDALPLLGHDRRSCRKALAVDGESTEDVVADPDHVL